MVLKVIFLAGTDIEKAFNESLRLAILLNCNIQFDFNGVNCTSMPNGNTNLGVLNYKKIINSDKEYKYIFNI